MSIKQKLLNAVSAHPKLATLAIGLAITMAIGTAIGMLDHSHMVYAATSQSNVNTGSNVAATSQSNVNTGSNVAATSQSNAIGQQNTAGDNRCLC